MFTQVLKIIERLFDNSYCRIYFHGQILQKCLIGETIGHHDVLKVFVPYIKNGDISNLIDGIQNIKIVKKFRYMDFLDINSNVPNVIICSFKVNSTIIFIEFHSEEKNNFLFDSDNLVLTKNGIIKWHENMDYKYASLDTLRSIRNLSIKECEYESNYNFMSSDFELMIHQNKKINEGFKVKNALNITDKKEQCPICYDIEHLYILKCYKNHKFCSNCLDKTKSSHDLAHNNDCPMCRRPIEFT